MSSDIGWTARLIFVCYWVEMVCVCGVYVMCVLSHACVQASVYVHVCVSF